MSAGERQKGVSIHRSIIYGSTSRLLTEEERASAPENHTHRWTVFLTSATSPPPSTPASSTVPPPDEPVFLPGGADDLTYLIKRVTFKLHDTYTNPSRVIDKWPFLTTETGWGEFTVYIKIQFAPETGEKPLSLQHNIKLHHWGQPIEGPTEPSVPITAPLEFAAPLTEEKEKGNEEKEKGIEEKEKGIDADGDVKMENQNPAGEESTSMPKPIDPKVSTATPPDPSTPQDEETHNTDEPEGQISVIAAPPPPISIAAKYPVHAWQYDELVFSDPTLAFYNYLNAHPPSLLPSKNRRAKDQREEHELKSGKRKGRVSAVSVAGRGSRAPSQEPSASVPAAETGTVLGTALGGIVLGVTGQTVGIPGEPGSADVPLEFSQEMEKGEWNRLNDARISIVAEMDRWREKLIAQEKDLAKLKEEMQLA